MALALPLAPHTVVEMPGGHFLHREHPERFIAALLRVLPGPMAR